MSEPLKLDEQKKSNWFRPHRKCGLYIGVTKYDQVSIKKNAATIQLFRNVSDVEKNVVDFKACMEKYGIKGEDAICLIDKSSKDVDTAVNDLSKKLRVAKKNSPVENILTVFLFAGRGMIFEGYQVLLYDEYDPINGFFKKFVAEKKICSWAEIYHNTYILCIISCDRNIHNP